MKAQVSNTRMHMGLTFLALAAVICIWLLARPFIHTILLACVAAALSWPLHAWILRGVSSLSLAAAYTLGILIIGTIVLFTAFFSLIIPQAVELARIAVDLYASGEGAVEAMHIGSSVSLMLNQAIASLQQTVDHISGALGIHVGNLQDMDLSSQLHRLGASLGKNVLEAAATAVSEVIYIIAHLVLLFFILYFLLRDGPSMLGFIKGLSPLNDEQATRLLHALRAVARAVFVGGILLAVCQGILAGIAFALVGLPALVLGVCSVLAAFVPVVGTALIWLPSAGYLYFAGHTWQAVFVAIWCAVLVSSSDSILRALFLKGGANMPILPLFLSIIGGFILFGVFGLLYGPLMLTFAWVALTMYVEYLSPKTEEGADPVERCRLRRPRARMKRLGPARRARPFSKKMPIPNEKIRCANVIPTRKRTLQTRHQA